MSMVTLEIMGFQKRPDEVDPQWSKGIYSMKNDIQVLIQTLAKQHWVAVNKIEVI